MDFLRKCWPYLWADCNLFVQVKLTLSRCLEYGWLELVVLDSKLLDYLFYKDLYVFLNQLMFK